MLQARDSSLCRIHRWHLHLSVSQRWSWVRGSALQSLLQQSACVGRQDDYIQYWCYYRLEGKKSNSFGLLPACSVWHWIPVCWSNKILKTHGKPCIRKIPILALSIASVFQIHVLNELMEEEEIEQLLIGWSSKALEWQVSSWHAVLLTFPPGGTAGTLDHRFWSIRGTQSLSSSYTSWDCFSCDNKL